MDHWQTARAGAWKTFGQRFWPWFVGWAILRRIAGPVLAFGAVVVASALAYRLLRAAGVFAENDEPAPAAQEPPPMPDGPALADPWPYVAIAVLGACVCALLAWRWLNPHRRGPAVPALVGLSALAILALIATVAGRA